MAHRPLTDYTRQQLLATVETLRGVTRRVPNPSPSVRVLLNEVDMLRAALEEAEARRLFGEYTTPGQHWTECERSFRERARASLVARGLTPPGAATEGEKT